MPTVQESTDLKSGRVTVRITDELTFIAPLGQPVPRTGAFTEVFRRELQGVTRGQVVIGSSIAPPAGFTGSLTMEINLVGYVGAQPLIIDRAALSATSPSRQFEMDDVTPYTAFGIEARQVVDGAPDTSVAPSQFQIQFLGLFWS